MITLKTSFKLSEISCNCGCGFSNYDLHFFKLLCSARFIADIPFIINSWCRCYRYNKQVGGVKDSAHLIGCAADISVVSPSYRDIIVSALKNTGFNRIGIAHDFIHVDSDSTKPQDIIWLY